MGDGLATTRPWRSVRAEAAFDASAVFWKETPEAGPADTAKFLARGVDPTRALSSGLSGDAQRRLAAAASSVGANPAQIERLRPWLAAVVLKQAQSRRLAQVGQAAANDSVTVLMTRAKAAAKPVQSEFPDTGSVVDFFAGLTEVAQRQYLMLALDDIERGPDVALRLAERWAAGDLSLQTREATRIAVAYPYLFAELVVARNKRWPERIRGMLSRGGASFVLVGSDHLVGPANVLLQLVATGLSPTRV
jgi:hypothetical protein